MFPGEGSAANVGLPQDEMGSAGFGEKGDFDEGFRSKGNRSPIRCSHIHISLDSQIRERYPQGVQEGTIKGKEKSSQ